MQISRNRGTKLRFGIVGAGRIAESYRAAFRESVNATLNCVADPVDSAAAALAARFGGATFASHREMAGSGLVDAVVVATPPNTHAEICLDLLEAGIPVLCEKPVSIEGESARAIRKRSAEKRVAFTMASKFRYAEDVIRAHNIVNSGILGDIVLFENTFMSAVPMSSRWNSNRSVSGGGVLIDNGTHSVDIMRYFIGPLTSIQVVSACKLQNLAVEETVHVTARSESGAVGRMDLSWSLDKQSDDYIAIYGSHGTLRVGWKRSVFRQQGSTEWIQFGTGYDKVQAFRNQIENFSAAVQGLEALLISADDAIASIDVIECGYRSMADGSWVSIPQSASAVNIAAA